MAANLQDLTERLARAYAMIDQLAERVHTLELQHLDMRLERAEELAEARAKDFDCQLLRLAEVVANVATR